MNEKTKRLTYFLVIGIISILILVSVLVILIFILFYFIQQPESISSRQVNTFQYQQVTLTPPENHDNSVQYGHVEINQHLKPEDYILYRNEVTGTHAIISNFGGSEYECTGTCYCTTTRRITPALTALSQTSKLLLTALSTVLAIRVAKEVFLDACIDQHSETCMSSDISTDAECTETNPQDKIDFENGQVAEFICGGHCLFSKKTIYFPDKETGEQTIHTLEELVDDIIPSPQDCEEYSLEGRKVEISKRDMEFSPEYPGLEEGGNLNDYDIRMEDLNIVARRAFYQLGTLEAYCELMSQERIEGVGYLSLCDSGERIDPQQFETPKNIHCVYSGYR